MTEKEIFEMIKDIVNNGAEYECRFKGAYTHSWTPYKLGDKVHREYWEYRKKEKWCVVKVEYCPDYIITLKNEHNKNEIYFEGSKEECEEWVG